MHQKSNFFSFFHSRNQIQSYGKDSVDKMGNNYYKVLLLNKNASDQEIRQAYMKLALKFHPDKNPNAGAEERFKLIGEAYSELKDPLKRAKFDKKLKDCRCQCSKCSAIFAKSADLTKHCEKYHPTEFKCIFCTSIAYFETSKDLIKHVSKFHQFKCDMCQTSFGKIEDLTQHKFNFHSVPVVCTFCQSKFVQLEELTKHAERCPQFNCNLCPTLSFKSLEDLTQHKKASHRMPFKCTYCNTSFAKYADVKQHISTTHGFKCNSCPAHFEDLALLSQHKKQYHSAIYGCKDCVSRFSSLNDLHNHVSSVHSLKCNLCSAVFKKMFHLTRHKEQFHSARFQCNHCALSFAGLEILNKHVRGYHTFKCDLCPALFRERALLTQHQEKCHSVMVNCTFCREAFANSEALNVHILNCHDLGCTMCPRRFVDMNLLTEHIIKCHPTTLVCNFCDHKFVKLSDKNLHMARSHHFDCDFCPSSFVRLADCLAHKKRCQSRTPQSKMFKCPFCAHSFPTSKSFNKHKRKKHPMPFKCTFCLEKFAFKEDINRHMSSVHEFKCEKCKSWFYIPQPGPSVTYDNVRKPISLGNAPVLCNKETCFLSCK